jgi:glucarate dehydratase
VLGVPESFVLNLVDLGGVRRTVEFVEACDHLGFGFWFHSGETSVATAAYLHVSAALEPISEPSQSLMHWTTDDVTEQGVFSPHAGFVTVPDGPGLGVTLDPVALRRCHERFLAEGTFPSGDDRRPELSVGSFGSLSRK